MTKYMDCIGTMSEQCRMLECYRIRAGTKISLTRQKPYDCLTDRGILFSIRLLTRSACGHTTVPQTGFFSGVFSKSFWTKTSVATPRSVRPGFFLKIFQTGTSMTIPRDQRRVRGMVTDVLGQKRD